MAVGQVIAAPSESPSLVRMAPILVFGVYLVLKPFYFFESGEPQIADAVMLLLVGLIAVLGPVRLHPQALRVLVWGTLFVAYLVAANVVWAGLLNRTSMLRPPRFHVYNLVIVAVTLHLHWRHGRQLFSHMAWALAASVLIQAALGVLIGDSVSGRRQVLFLNNPNQLGYWALLSATLFFLCASRVPVRPWLQVVVGAAALYVVALSLSKAALISTGCLLVLANARRVSHVVAAAAVGLVVLVAVTETSVYENAADRLASIGEQEDDDLTTRGYDRIWKWPQYLLLGAGEGAYERFRVYEAKEFHSTLGTILFSYGLIGAGLFVAWMVSVWRVAGLYATAFLVPPLLFGVAHQGLRFSLLWVLIALIACVDPPDEAGSPTDAAGPADG